MCFSLWWRGSHSAVSTWTLTFYQTSAMIQSGLRSITTSSDDLILPFPQSLQKTLKSCTTGKVIFRTASCASNNTLIYWLMAQGDTFMCLWHHNHTEQSLTEIKECNKQQHQQHHSQHREKSIKHKSQRGQICFWCLGSDCVEDLTVINRGPIQH